MHGRSSGEVQAAHLVDPAGGIPGPAGDGVVDDGGPDEHEDDAGKHAASVRCCSDGQGRSGRVSSATITSHHGPSVCSRNGSEHALIDGKEQIRNLWTSHGRMCQNVSEADVVEVPNVLARAMRKRQRVSPEEPLERHNRGGHQRQPDQRESRLPPGKAGVEEADARDHEQDQRRRSDDPCEVAGGVEDIQVIVQRVPSTGVIGVVERVQRDIAQAGEIGLSQRSALSIRHLYLNPLVLRCKHPIQ